MYNTANAESTNPQPVHYSVGSSGNLQISTSPSVASTPSVQATNQSPSANATSTQTINNLTPSTSTSPYMNANTPAAQQYIALAKAYGVANNLSMGFMLGISIMFFILMTGFAIKSYLEAN